MEMRQKPERIASGSKSGSETDSSYYLNGKKCIFVRNRKKSMKKICYHLNMTGNIAKVLLVAILLAAIVSCTPNSPATGKVNIEEVTEAVSDALSTNFVINGIKSRSLKGENLGQMLSYILSNDDEFLNEYSSALENLEMSPAFDISSNESQYGKLRMWGEIAQSDTVINGEMHLSLILPSSQRIELSIENMTENLEKRSVDAAFTLVDEREHDGTLVSFHMS